jgi:hypothetical protein
VELAVNLLISFISSSLFLSAFDSNNFLINNAHFDYQFPMNLMMLTELPELPQMFVG